MLGLLCQGEQRFVRKEAALKSLHPDSLKNSKLFIDSFPFSLSLPPIVDGHVHT